MREIASAALVIWHDVVPEAETLVEEWYNREHQLERVRLPGFFSARRHVAVAGSPRLFNIYRVRDLSALMSPEYRAILENPTEGSRRAIPHFRNMSRTACRFVVQLGDGEGTTSGTWRLSAEVGQQEGLIAWLRDKALPEALAGRGIVSVALLLGDPASSTLPSRERTLRNNQDRLADLVLVITASDPEAIIRVERGGLRESELRVHGAQAGSVFGLYRLVYSI